MTISVTIDSCAWNFFFDRKYDLCVELPAEKFSLFITREVEIELLQMPDLGKDAKDKRPLKAYIHSSIECRHIEIAGTFGFWTEDVPGAPQRFLPFGQGTFQSDSERDWLQREETQGFLSKKKRRSSTALRPDEGDVYQAVASLSSVMITNERKTKKGPIADAAANGGLVLYLSDFESSGLTLVDYIEMHFAMTEGTLRRLDAV